MNRYIFTERGPVAEAIRLILPEFAEARVVGRSDIPAAIASLQKGDVVAGSMDVPGLAKITAAGAKFLGFGVSASKAMLDEMRPNAQQLVSVDFKGRLQEVCAYRDESAEMPEEVEVYSHQLLSQICHFLSERGVKAVVTDRIHPSHAEVIDSLRVRGMQVDEASAYRRKYGVGRIGRDWQGRTVVGHMMPRHATEYCTAGATYFHFELPGRPAHKHNHNWTIEELKSFNATFVKYAVWRWGKSIRLFDQSDAEINL